MIVLYTTHCPKCQVLTKKLNAANINYEVCEDVKIMEEKNFSSIPVLEINNKVYNFTEAVQLINEGGIIG